MTTDEFQVMLRKVVQEELDAHFELLLQDLKVAMRDVAREADDAQGEP